MLPEVKPPKEVEGMYDRIGRQHLSERTFYFGLERKRATALNMESVPGTVEMVIRLLAEYPSGTKVLDYGCGQHKSAYLRAMGFSVHSCDILDFQLDNYTKVDPKAEHLPFSDRQFQVSVISEVVEHIENPWAILRELMRVTSEAIIITTPNVASLKSKEVFAATGYLHWFTPDIAYHITPVFYWQLQRFVAEQGWAIEAVYGNHQAFGLADQGKILDFAESIIVRITPPKHA